ncbi:MAG: asparagine synthase (glutamine-hydrolyzing) [Cryomorphaceae bacterium]|nr:MAG: asparagine synthase (glutamine-hydrolyzing) [Cryomorphaceae bacterium]
MCGIAGIFNYSQPISAGDEDRLLKAVEKIAHRGPDFRQVRAYGKLCLGHARLSILDTSAASNQPMQTEDGRYAIVFNGEIYNFKSLRSDLEKLGHYFTTTGDTEVLLKAWAQWGPGCLERLNGFFAFAVYDSQLETMWLARDRMGIKPLYYNLQPDIICFGSEMSVFKVLGVNPELDVDALHLFFQLTYIPAPYTALKGVQKLMPGEFLTVRDRKVEKQPYFDLQKRTASADSYESAVENVRQLLDESVRMRLVSDVPLGTFLSGGIDSSIVSYIASQHLSGINTFSVGFDDHAYLDESACAAQVAGHIGSTHHEIRVGKNEMEEAAFAVLNHLDEPFADSSSIAVYMLSKYTARHVKVILSGDGADELFGGYRKHMALYRASQKSASNLILKSAAPLLSLLPGGSRSDKQGDFLRKLRKYSDGLRLPFRERYHQWLRWTDEATVFSLLKEKHHQALIFDQLPGLDLDENDFNSVLISDQLFLLPNDMLAKVDKMSMAHGLEVRTPFLDHHLVQYVNNLPSGYKLNASSGKLMLRNAFHSVLPAEVFNRPKKGFEVPMESWLRSTLKELVVKFSNRQLIEEQAVFNPSVLEDIQRDFYQLHNNKHASLLWSFLVFQSWWFSTFRRLG